LEITENQKSSSLSEDLTVIFLRGNGSPRTFRVSLPALQRSLTALGFAFTFALFATIFLLLLNFFRSSSEPNSPVVVSAPSSSPTVSPSTPVVTASKPEAGFVRRGGFWSAITGAVRETGKADPEQQKELQGLHEDIARLNAQLDGRKELPKGDLQGLLQFFGPRNIPVAPDSAPIQVKNAAIVHDPATKQLYVDFEIHNVDPDQKQVRGYIVVLGKTKNFLGVYPANAFAPSQNIVLDYTKGETFAVSRFRQARATFAAARFEDENPKFQVLLFGSDGRVLADLHTEESH
jgi:hypothetical protein